jgi:undecaprenyl phosphate-alpha-L-ara4N flippase subunit ArnE
MSPTAIGIFLVVLCAIIEGFAQVFLKKSALPSFHSRFWVLLGVAFFIAEALLYTRALRFLDVSIAFPIGSLSFIVVTILSLWLLEERVTPARWLGVCLILAGVGLVMARA